ncbi:kinase-like domain-containing protein [Penicillium malachiteum]|uniref:Kinase-like domain-containing protein n=1 Tax=Penicillium malachiteum TaxID=1324776 RepID=A0AAD6HY23_9EURO|nr:kinase-like domain-containing protein [Penicillium malachiteum]
MSTVESPPPSPNSRGVSTEPTTPEPSNDTSFQSMPLLKQAHNIMRNLLAKQFLIINLLTVSFFYYIIYPTFLILDGGSVKYQGVDLYLCLKNQKDTGVTGLYVRLNWVKGASGFFLITDNKGGKKVIMDGEAYRTDRCLIQPKNTIMIGECVFTLQYTHRNSDKEEQFQTELRQFFRSFYGKQYPLILPTPGENDSRFKDWIFQQPLSRGSFGIVHMVINSQTGRPAVAKRILKSERNEYSVDREIRMARRISELTHRSKNEIDRIKMYLDEKWAPTADNLTAEYIIISPLLNATFRSLYSSNVSITGREIFFSQLLEAIAFLHTQGISHRDVKPDNILVRSYDPPDAMLTDFGCASDKAVILYDKPGTIPYLAPEQVQGQTHGKAVDYWSCGVVGSELIRKRPIPTRLLPGNGLADYRNSLADSNLARCSRAMLEVDPVRRMTAAVALRLFYPTQVQSTPAEQATDRSH